MKKKNLISVFLVIVICAVSLAPVCAWAEDWGIVAYSKIQLHTYPSASSTANDVPYVDANVSDFQVRSISEGLGISSWSLTDEYGNVCYGKIQNRNYWLTVNVVPLAFNGVFAPGTTAIINGVAANVSVSADYRTATVTRLVTPRLIAPVVWHNPTDETHNEGETFSFVATASPYFNSCRWYLQSPYGEQYPAEDAGSLFTGTVAVIGDIENGSRCNLNNVRGSFDGWQIWCEFTGQGGTVRTNKAAIHVKNIAPSTPVPTIQVIQTPEPTIQVISTPKPVEVEIIETPAPTIEIVQWENKWTVDETAHWHKSVDAYSDEIDAKAPHDFEWTVTREATKKIPGSKTGVCSACGFTVEESIAYEKGSNASGMSTGGKIGLGAGAGAVVIAAIAGIIAKMKSGRKKNNSAKKSTAKYSGKH